MNNISLPPGGRWRAKRDGRSQRDVKFVLTLLQRALPLPVIASSLSEKRKKGEFFSPFILLLERITGLGLSARRASVTVGSDSHSGCHSLPPLSNPCLSFWEKKKGRIFLSLHLITGADYGARTRHLNLGKVALYQMS